MIRKIDSNETITIADLGSNGVKVTYCPNFESAKLEMIRLSKAVIKFNLNSATNQNCKVYHVNESLGTESIIDEFQTSSEKVLINITDELQNCIVLSQESIVLRITNLTADLIDQAQSTPKAYIDYFYKKESIEDQSNLKIESGRAGNGEINLSTGRFKFTFNDLNTNSQVFPISLRHIYDSLDKNSQNLVVPYFDSYKTLTPTKCGMGWRTNFNQYIIKEILGNDTFSDKKTSTRYTYVDGNGDHIIFQDRYYLIDANGDKRYLSLNQIHVNQDGKLEYLNEDGLYQEVKKETVSTTGLTLTAKLEGMQGLSLLDQDNEEILSLKDEINSLNKSKEDANLQITNNLKSIELLNMSSEINLLSQQSQELSLKNEESDINLQKNTKQLNKDYRTNYEAYSNLVDTRTYEFKDTATNYDAKVNYPTSEEANLKEICDSKSKEIEDLTLNATWGDENVDGIINRREQSLTKQKLILEKNKTYSSEQLALELKRLNEQNELLNENIKEYDELLIKRTHQLELLQDVSAEIVITDNDGNMLAFSITGEKDVYKLFAMVDAYENQVQIIYEGSHIEKIVDSDNNTIKFSYEEDLLVSVEDSRKQKIMYKYDDKKNLIEVNYQNKECSQYKYDEDGNLIEILNDNGMGVKLEYINNCVSKIENISYASKISKNTVEKNLSNNPVIDNSISISYNNFESTSVINNKTKEITTYVFDTIGRVINKYENVFENGSITGFVKAVSYERVTDKSSFTIQEMANSENLLKDLISNTTQLISENYIGDGVECGDDIVAYSVPFNGNDNEVFVCDLNNPIISYKLPNEAIEKIKLEDMSNLVLSGWAKADSAWVSRHNNDYCGNCDDEEYLDIDLYKRNRRFELRAELKYLNNGTEKTTEQYLSFDWMNTEWQYCACPVIISSNSQDELKEITVYFDYSNNTGSAKFFGMSLKEGSWSYSEFDNKLKTYEQSSNSKYATYYKYNENKKLEKTIIKDLISKEEFVTEYYYNDNGSLIKNVSFDGLVNERVYNDKGSLIKSITYHKDEPANRFVSVNEYDDKGKSDSEFNDFGEKVAQNTYVDKTNLVETTTDMNGNKTSYGYDTYDDTLLQITTTVNNEINSNTLNYTGNLLTGLLHNDIEINFTYDGFGNQIGVSLAGVDYLETEYQDIMGSQTLEDGSTQNIVIGKKSTTTNALQEKFITYTDLDGNVTQIDFVDKNNISFTMLKNSYDGYGNLTGTLDNDLNSETIIEYDEYARVISKSYTQNNKSITLTYTYDKYDNVINTTISIGDNTTTYSNNFDTSTPNTKLNSISIGVMTESYVYDKLGRVKETKLANLYTKLFNYKQVGCQTSNLIASEWFGVNGVLKDNLKYSYDEKGNITEVFENGELVQSFEYDSISRLLRENNKKLNKTVTYEYDGGGNIVRKVEYSYTTTQTENLTNGIAAPYLYPVTGWRDQLVSYNNQNIVYDLMGNPTTYLGKTLQWSHGRQLDKIDNFEYKYNADGIRTSKTVNGITTHFYLDGTKLLGQDNGNLLVFHYGNEGVIGFTYQGVGEFYYKKNIFGDVLSIINSSGQEIVKYVYDAWGKHKTFVLDNGNFVDIETQTSYTQSGSNNNVIAELNPFRYRSYYYDTETGLYYLNSRYYDPSTCKFINADDVSILFEGKDIINGLNLYIYCGNNPITNTDDSGQAWWNWLWKIAVAVVVVVALGVAAAFTGGTAGVILGSAFYGAITGGLSSAVIGGVVGGITNGWNGFLNGFANGLLSGVIVGGATAALTAGINIATGAVKIVGSAQKTGAFFHRFASNVQAGKMAMQIGRYSQITLDRSLNKAGLVGRKMPDVIGTARWGKNLLVEVTSKTQFKYQMINKLNQIVSYNSNVKIKVISWVGWLARLFK